MNLIFKICKQHICSLMTVVLILVVLYLVITLTLYYRQGEIDDNSPYPKNSYYRNGPTMEELIINHGQSLEESIDR